MSESFIWLADLVLSPFAGLHHWWTTTESTALELALPVDPQPETADFPGPIATDPVPDPSLIDQRQAPLVPLNLTLSPRGRLTFVELEPTFVYQLLTARDITTLDRLCPPLLHHYLHLAELSSDRSWTPAARATRALRAGVSAARVVAGSFEKQAASLRLSGVNRHYIVLRCQQLPGGFYTQDFSIYITYLRTATGSLQRGSVSHAFETAAEVEIFLRGAHRQWPVELPGGH